MACPGGRPVHAWARAVAVLGGHGNLRCDDWVAEGIMGEVDVDRKLEKLPSFVKGTTICNATSQNIVPVKMQI